MGLSDEQQRDLTELIWAARDGVITEVGVAQLEQLVHEEPEARRIYVQSTDMIAELLWTSAAGRELEPADASVAGDADIPHVVVKDPIETRRKRRGFGRIVNGLRPHKHPIAFASVCVGLTAVWCFALFGVMWWSLGPPTQPVVAQAVAHITGTHGAVWDEGSETATAESRIAGLLAGGIPGFTIAMAVVLTLPFTFGMPPLQGLATMIGVFVGGLSGGFD